jgi:hypothetical protein
MTPYQWASGCWWHSEEMCHHLQGPTDSRILGTPWYLDTQHHIETFWHYTQHNVGTSWHNTVSYCNFLTCHTAWNGDLLTQCHGVSYWGLLTHCHGVSYWSLLTHHTASYKFWTLRQNTVRTSGHAAVCETLQFCKPTNSSTVQLCAVTSRIKHFMCHRTLLKFSAAFRYSVFVRVGQVDDVWEPHFGGTLYKSHTLFDGLLWWWWWWWFLFIQLQ